MLYGDTIDYLKTFIDVDKKNESFDYTLNEMSSLEMHLDELHKFNQIYNSFFLFDNRMVYMINNYEILLKKEDLKQIVKLYMYFKKHNSNNCFLLAEFLVSYFNSINTIEYKNNVNNYKEVRKDFRQVIIVDSRICNILDELILKSYELYNKIIDYGLTQKDFFLGDIMERGCVNLRISKELKKKFIKKLLKNQIYPSKTIIYDENVRSNKEYYKKYILNFKNGNVYNKYPEEILFILDREKLLTKTMFNTILNKIIERVGILQNKATDEKESFIQIVAESDELIKILNKYLNKIQNMNKKQKAKIHECLKNILYIKRFIVSDQERLNAQMQEFKYEQTIPHKEINEFVSSINENVGRLYTSSCGNFIKELEMALKSYSEYPVSYIFNSYNIDSESQIYLKSDEGIEDSIFKTYYDKKGQEYTKNHPELRNRLDEGYYIQLLKYLKHSFLTCQHFILSFFNTKEKNRVLIDKLISKGSYKLKNDYVILAMNVVQIENTIIEILKKKGGKIFKDGFKNLNELANDYFNDDLYFNGLMYINYILYERHGLNIRNNISHGNYFKKNVEVEIMTTLCAIMFLNNLSRKECGLND